MNASLTTASANVVAELLEKGGTYLEIAKRVGVSPSAVARFATKIGHRRGKSLPTRGRPWALLDDQRLIEMALRRRSQRHVARVLGRRQQRINERAKKLGVRFAAPRGGRMARA